MSAGYALEPGEAEAYEREQERADSPREPRACPFCTGSGSHCPECSDDEDEE